MRYIPLILLLLLVACSDGSRGGGAPYPDPAKYEVRGLDLSAHNGDVDFSRVRADGYEFVILKATEGASFKDRKFLDNVREARDAGLKVGAYHFFRFDTPGYMQGLNLLHSVGGRELDLPLIIDLEEWTNPNRQATPLVLDRLGEMISHLERHGYRVMLYSNKNGHTRFIRDRLDGYPLWLCSLGEEPQGVKWTLWQATHNGRAAGVSGAVDINAFHGSRAEWEKFVAGERQ